METFLFYSLIETSISLTLYAKGRGPHYADIITENLYLPSLSNPVVSIFDMVYVKYLIATYMVVL